MNDTPLWFEVLPPHWRVSRLAAHLERNDSGAWGADATIPGEGVPVLRSTDITIDGAWSKPLEPEYRVLDPNAYRTTRLAVNDLLVTKSSGSERHIGKTALVTQEVADLAPGFSNFMQRLRCTDTLWSRYAWYCMNSPITRLQLNYWASTTTGLANLNGSLLGRLRIAMPALPEQCAITDFLDHETGKIELLVAKKQHLLESLQELERALIDHAICAGWSPTDPTLPNGWRVLRLQHLTRPDKPIMYGIVLPGPHVPGGVPLIKGGDVERGLSVATLNRTTVAIDAEHARSRVNSGDIVFAIRGSYGAVAQVPRELKGANLTQDAARVSPGSGVDNDFLFYALRSSAVFAQVEAGAVGATIKGINIRDLKRARIPVPPLDEQKALAGLVSRELTLIRARTSKIRQGIDLMRELKSVVVTAAVTGQIDVTNSVRTESAQIDRIDD